MILYEALLTTWDYNIGDLRGPNSTLLLEYATGGMPRHTSPLRSSRDSCEWLMTCQRAQNEEPIEFATEFFVYTCKFIWNIVHPLYIHIFIHTYISSSIYPHHISQS